MDSVKYIAAILVLLQQVFAAAYAQEENPCGPASVLGLEIAANVAHDSRCFELRFYTADPAEDGIGGVDNLHRRFREKQQELLTAHGAELIGYWQRLDNPNTIVWLLAFKDRAHRDEVFANFRADPEWIALREKYNVPVQRELFFMSATDYSALK